MTGNSILPNIVIRPFNISDRERLIHIFRLNTPTYFDSNEEKDFMEYLDKHGDTYFVVERENVIVGGGGYHFTDRNTIGRISWDMFHPESRGCGFGKQLVAHCLNKLRSEPSVKMLSVWTSQHANNFYGKFGFELKEIRKDYWGPGLDLYRMEMDVGHS